MIISLNNTTLPSSGVTPLLLLEDEFVTYFHTRCVLLRVSFLVCALRWEACSALFIIAYVSRLRLVDLVWYPDSVSNWATFTASSGFLGIFGWGDGVKLRGQGVELLGGSTLGVSLPGLSIIMASGAGDFVGSLQSLLCRSFAAV